MLVVRPSVRPLSASVNTSFTRRDISVLKPSEWISVKRGTNIRHISGNCLSRSEVKGQGQGHIIVYKCVNALTAEACISTMWR